MRKVWREQGEEENGDGRVARHVNQWLERIGLYRVCIGRCSRGVTGASEVGYRTSVWVAQRRTVRVFLAVLCMIRISKEQAVAFWLQMWSLQSSSSQRRGQGQCRVVCKLFLERDVGLEGIEK